MKVVAVVLIAFLVAAIFGLYWWAFQALWNFVVCGIFHGPWHLSYWQAAAVATLLGIIGGAFGKSVSKS